MAKDLNISVGSLYSAFGDLEAIVSAVIAKSAVKLSENLLGAIEIPATDKRARLVALAEAYFDFAVAEPKRWWLMFDYRSNLPPDGKALDFQSGLLEMLIRAGEVDPDSDQHQQFSCCYGRRCMNWSHLRADQPS